MITRNIKMAMEAQVWLREHGSHVAESWLGVARPLLEITCPPPELVKCAIPIMVRKAGGVQVVWAARLNGCQIIWR